ncbi:MAG TPA: PilZ domain-containing protein [Gemmataceae bacterium]|jgi:hypothetical protein|nr:PilZ domain-containing protein [Gemmataceae bacterium]
MNQLPETWHVRPAVEVPAEETVVDLPPRPSGGFACRRNAARFAPKPGVRVEVRPWGAGAGQDVAQELLDLSELGLRVRLRMPVRVSGQFEVTLRDAASQRVCRVMAIIRWSTRSQDGGITAGLELSRPLLPEVVRRIAGAPMPAAPPARPS